MYRLLSQLADIHELLGRYLIIPRFWTILIGLEETFGGDGYVYGIKYDDGFIGVYLSPSSSSYTH